MPYLVDPRGHVSNDDWRFSHYKVLLSRRCPNAPAVHHGPRLKMNTAQAVCHTQWRVLSSSYRDHCLSSASRQAREACLENKGLFNCCWHEWTLWNNSCVLRLHYKACERDAEHPHKKTKPKKPFIAAEKKKNPKARMPNSSSCRMQQSYVCRTKQRNNRCTFSSW